MGVIHGADATRDDGRSGDRQKCQNGFLHNQDRPTQKPLRVKLDCNFRERIKNDKHSGLGSKFVFDEQDKGDSTGSGMSTRAFSFLKRGACGMVKGMPIPNDCRMAGKWLRHYRELAWIPLYLAGFKA